MVSNRKALLPLAVAISLALGCDPGSEGPIGAPPDASGGASPSQKDSGTHDGSASGGTGGQSVPHFDASVFSPPQTGNLCVLEVGARCDGPEDCPPPQSCCAEFDPVRFRYSSISCKLGCGVPPALNEFELCHRDQGCRDPSRECRRSVIIPHDFITVCADHNDLVLNTDSSKNIENRVVCGQDRCIVGAEQCCLRSELDFSKGQTIALDPFCAPLDASCDCDAQPPLVDIDGGSE